ncbi:MAG: response regulator [Balneolaceae bacterium]
MGRPLTIEELKIRLTEAEEILQALRNHEVDAVIGTDQIAMLKLKQMEDELHDQIQISGNRLKEIESIYKNVPVGLCILDRELKFIRVNEHLAKIHGISSEDHMGKKMSELLPDLAGNTDAALQHVLDTGQVQMNVELTGKIANNLEQRYLLEHWLPLHNREGDVIGINMVIDEITDRKQFEEKLRQLNSTLEKRVAERTKLAEERADKLREMAIQMTHVEENERQRLARVLHDGLQQLLIGAKFNTKLISNQVTGQNEIKEQLEELNEILDQSIEASRSLSYELSPPILHDHGLLAALQWLANMRHMKGLTIEIHAENEIPKLSQSLKVLLFQEVKELLINVLKHAHVDKAEVRLSSDEKNISIEVIDEGRGFDMSGDDFGSTKSQGLRNIREKMELMNGRLEIDSEPGRGSHFTLVVPIDEDEKTIPENVKRVPDKKSARVETSYEENGSTSGIIKVLVVDDHQVMRNGLVRLLNKEADINIIGEASNGVEAIDFVHNQQPDVIIMDITMPEMDGIEATRLIHQDYKDIRIIGLSMHEESEYSDLIKQAGAVDMLSKGGPSEMLFDAIRKVYEN